jgi:hypothetical protein
MIAKFKSGSGFKGLLNYANNLLKSADILASDGVSLLNNTTIANSFRAQAKSVKTNDKVVGHLILSFSPNDRQKLGGYTMVDIAKDFMNRMGIRDTQYVIFGHHDQPHPHLHIVYNRVNNFGEMITCDTNYHKSAAISAAITREYGLTFGKDKSKVRREHLRGKDRIKYKIYDTVTAELNQHRSMNSLINALRLKGIDISFKNDTNGNIRGIIFTCDNVSFSGGKVDRSLTFPNIMRQLNAERFIGGDEFTTRSFSSHGTSGSTGGSNTAASSSSTAFESSSSDAGNNANSASSTSVGDKIAGVATEIILQPHVVQTPCGGGGSSKSKNDDEDEDKYKRKRRSRGR